jgi:hypothetical protein
MVGGERIMKRNCAIDFVALRVDAAAFDHDTEGAAIAIIR